jgi:hypothetical protein
MPRRQDGRGNDGRTPRSPGRHALRAAPPSKGMGAGMTLLLTGIDTLHLACRVRRFNLTDGETRYLRQNKAAVRASSMRSPGGVGVRLRGRAFKMLPQGRAPGLEWVLVNADLTVAIAERPEPEVPAWTVELALEFRSAYLWQHSPAATVEAVLGWVAT